MKAKNILLALSLSVGVSALAQEADIKYITQKKGATLGYSTSSGVKILTVGGKQFKDLNKNGKPCLALLMAIARVAMEVSPLPRVVPNLPTSPTSKKSS